MQRFPSQFSGEVKGWILNRVKMQKLGNLCQCIPTEGPLQYLNYPCNLYFFTTEGECSKSQHRSYFCWVPSGDFSMLVPAGYTGKIDKFNHILSCQMRPLHKGWAKGSEVITIFEFLLPEKSPLTKNIFFSPHSWKAVPSSGLLCI